MNANSLAHAMAYNQELASQIILEEVGVVRNLTVSSPDGRTWSYQRLDSEKWETIDLSGRGLIILDG